MRTAQRIKAEMRAEESVLSSFNVLSRPLSAHEDEVRLLSVDELEELFEELQSIEPGFPEGSTSNGKPACVDCGCPLTVAQYSQQQCRFCHFG